MAPTSRRGFGLVQLLVVIVIMAVGMALILPQLSNVAGTQKTSQKQKLKATTNLRGIQQGVATLTTMGGTAGLPRPSDIDRDHGTVAATPFAKRNGVDPGKDTTANIFSFLIYERVVVLEQVIDGAELNPYIVRDDDYQFGSPRTAAEPGRARWDPAFSADFTQGSEGNVSYANQRPISFGRNMHPSSQPMFSHRGPQLASPPMATGTTVSWTAANPLSYTLDQETGSWSGGIVYADGHVDYIYDVAPVTYVNDAGETLADVLFYDEEDAPDGLNAFVSIFLDAGEEPADFYEIWD
jgi:hypothetical protein